MGGFSSGHFGILIGILIVLAVIIWAISLFFKK